MRLLTYYVAVGQRYRDMCQLSLSLNQPTDLAVITDEPWADYCQQAPNGVDPRHLKAKIGEFRDLNQYDLALYVDCDVIVQKPVQPTLLQAWRQGKLLIQRGFGHASGYANQVPLPTWCLKEPDFCTGIICFPLWNSLGQQMLRRWDRACQRYGGCDQVCWHEAFYSSGLKRNTIEWMPDAAHYHRGYHGETYIHFYGHMQAQMKRWVDETYYAGTIRHTT